jgi:predicted dithiol-disulfide oxidoreductase (DUF899 family)
VDGWHGTSALLREGGQISRTYVIDSRGDEALGSTWSYLDMTALGRQEQWEPPPPRACFSDRLGVGRVWPVAR